MADPIESYRYQRNCSLQSCNKLFGTNYKRQRFCKDPHRIEYHTKLQQNMRCFHDLMERIGDFKRIHKAFEKAAKEAGRMADLLISIRGGGNLTDTTKTKG